MATNPASFDTASAFARSRSEKALKQTGIESKENQGVHHDYTQKQKGRGFEPWPGYDSD
jgi:hypothetical protein